MQFFLYFISILWLAFGFLLLITPELMHKFYINKFTKVRNFKLWCLIPIMLGVLFILSARSLWIKTFAYAMAMVTLFKGLYLMVLKDERIKEIMDWWLNVPTQCLRIWGLFLISLASILLSLIKYH
jgi:uncharacterized protein YjeT (DUF2065 family)